jgi:hypothetical protein
MEFFFKRLPYLDDSLEGFSGLLVFRDQLLTVAAPRSIELNYPHTVAIQHLKQTKFTRV